MTDSDAFLSAILADPDDKLPRLVFFDYLEERGHPHAVEWRRQVEEGKIDPKGRALPTRELLASDPEGLERTGVFATITWDNVGGPSPTAYYWGGLPDVLVLNERQFLEHGPSIFNLYPVRRVIIAGLLVQVRLWHRTGEVEALVSAPEVVSERVVVLPGGEMRRERERIRVQQGWKFNVNYSRYSAAFHATAQWRAMFPTRSEMHLPYGLESVLVHNEDCGRVQFDNPTQRPTLASLARLTGGPHPRA